MSQVDLGLYGTQKTILLIIHVHIRHGVPIYGDNGHLPGIGIQHQQKNGVCLAGIPALLMLAEFFIHINPHAQEGEDIFVVVVDLSAIADPVLFPCFLRRGRLCLIGELRHPGGCIFKKTCFSHPCHDGRGCHKNRCQNGQNSGRPNKTFLLSHLIPAPCHCIGYGGMKLVQ